MVVDLRTYHLYSYFKILKARDQKNPPESKPKVWPSLVSAFTAKKEDRRIKHS